MRVLSSRLTRQPTSSLLSPSTSMLLSFPQKKSTKIYNSKTGARVGDPCLQCWPQGRRCSCPGWTLFQMLLIIELDFKCCWLLNFISNAEQWTLSFISNADKWAESKDDNDVWCWSAETVCKENYTSSKFHFLLIKMIILIKLMLMQVESKLVTMLTHPEAVQCIRSSNVNEEL